MSKRYSDLEANEEPSSKKQQLELVIHTNVDDVTSHIEGKEGSSALNAQLEPDVHGVTSDLEGSEKPSVTKSKLESDVDDVTSNLEGNEGPSALNAPLEPDFEDITSPTEPSDQFSNNESPEQIEHDSFSDITQNMPNRNTVSQIRKEIQDLERQRFLNSSSISSINFISRYWERFDHDWCLMLQKLDSESNETFQVLEVDQIPSSSIYQIISQIDPENLNEQLGKRVEKTKEVISNVIMAFNKHKKRKELLEAAIEKLSGRGMEDDNTAKDVYNQLRSENNKLENFTLSLQKSYHNATSMIDNLKKSYDTQDVELKKLQSQYDKLLVVNRELHRKNYELEMDLTSLNFNLNNIISDNSEAQRTPDPPENQDENIDFIDDESSQDENVPGPESIASDGDVSQNHENSKITFNLQEQDAMDTIGTDNCEQLESVSSPLSEPEYPTDAADELDKLAISTLSDITSSIEENMQDMDFLEQSTSKF